MCVLGFQSCVYKAFTLLARGLDVTCLLNRVSPALIFFKEESYLNDLISVVYRKDQCTAFC